MAVKESKERATGHLPIYRPAADQKALEARVASLPKKLRRFIRDSGLLPDMPRRTYIERAQQAKLLTEAVGEVFEVTYEPSSFLEDDMDATGYLFDVSLDYELKLDRMTLDAREPDLRGQMADELRRVAAHFIGAAVALESTLPGDEVSESKTYQPHDGQRPEDLPPIRVAIFRDGKHFHTVELPHPAVVYAKQWKALSLTAADDHDELRVLAD